MASLQTKETHCLRCNHYFEAASGPRGVPSPGHLSICIECGNMAVFTEDMDVRPMTTEDRKRVPSEAYAISKKIEVAWLRGKN